MNEPLSGPETPRGASPPVAADPPWQVTDEAVQAALAGVIRYQKDAREPLWTAQVRAMLEAAAPLIAGDAAARLAAVEARCREWAALAPADDWGESMGDTAIADCGRAILAITSSEEGNARDG